MAVNPIIVQRCRSAGIPELTDLVLKAVKDGTNLMSYVELSELISKHIWELSAEANKAIANVADKRHDNRLRRLPFDKLKENWISTIVGKASKQIDEVEKWKKIQQVAAEIFKDFAKNGQKFQDTG